MRLEFQKSIASSKFLLPAVGIAVTIMWTLLPSADGVQPCGGKLWGMCAELLSAYGAERYVGYAVCAVAVYLMAELNNSHALLRISSRMLSSVLAILLVTDAAMLELQPGSVMLLLTMLSYLSLLDMYQMHRPSQTFVMYLCVGVMSVLCPVVLALVPVYWMMQGVMRSINLRTVVASLLGLLLPYWFVLAISICCDRIDIIEDVWQRLQMVELGDYAVVSPYQWSLLAYVVLTMLIGMVDFVIHAYLDKTRTRCIYNILVLHGIAVALLIVLQVQWLDVLLPIMMIDAAILFGHFVAQTYTRASHLICLVWFASTIALIVYGVIE